MKITVLVENESRGQLTPVHGLSLYIECAGRRILFDMGPDETFLKNAEALGIDIAGVDLAMISHGHNDHGGGLPFFLQRNHTAPVYVQEDAFTRHYSRRFETPREIGLDPAWKDHPQVRLLNGDTRIDPELFLFTVPAGGKCLSPVNEVLYTEDQRDDFRHEQNLLLQSEGKTLLLTGCGHSGIVNILEKAADAKPQICIGGFHLFNPHTGESIPREILDQMAVEMAKHSCRYYTCHCTGRDAFTYIQQQLSGIDYLSCGDVLEF